MRFTLNGKIFTTLPLIGMVSYPAIEVYGKTKSLASPQGPDDDSTRAIKRNYNLAIARGDKKEMKRLERQLLSIGSSI